MDMRWGVTDEMLNDHQVTDLCIKEIENCQQVSCGPSFVVSSRDDIGRAYMTVLRYFVQVYVLHVVADADMYMCLHLAPPDIRIVLIDEDTRSVITIFYVHCTYK